MIRKIATVASALACLVSGILAAHAQAAAPKPKTPAAIVAESRRIAERNEACRLEANAQHLHLMKRRAFMRACKKRNI